MALLTGSSTAEIDAPIGQVWAFVQDVERAPEWQGGLTVTGRVAATALTVAQTVMWA